MFLVLPIALPNGTASIVYQPSSSCYPYPCLGLNPLLMTPFWTLLGVIGILLGLLVPKVSPRLGSGAALGLAFSLGSMALLFWTVTQYILKTFIITSETFLLFPETSIVAMALATGLFSCELFLRRRDAAAAITS